MRMQRYEEAVESYWRSLLLRPHYAATHLNLGYALKDSVRLEEAIAEWEQTLRLATRRQGRNWFAQGDRPRLWDAERALDCLAWLRIARLQPVLCVASTCSRPSK